MRTLNKVHERYITSGKKNTIRVTKFSEENEKLQRKVAAQKLNIERVLSYEKNR